MAAAVVVHPDPNLTHGSPLEFGRSRPLTDCKFYRWSLTASDNDTHATGIPGIVEYAVTATRDEPGTIPIIDMAREVRVSAVSAAGTFTFLVTGTDAPFDLLVWAK